MVPEASVDRLASSHSLGLHVVSQYCRYQHDGQTDYGDALYFIIICHVGKMGTLSVSSTAASGCFVLLLTQLGLACCNPVSSLLCDPNAPLVPQMCGRQISAFLRSLTSRNRCMLQQLDALPATAANVHCIQSQ